MNKGVEEEAAVGEKEGYGTDQADEGETNEEDNTTQEGPDELGEEL